jgi:hypothetical protein
MAAGKQCQMPHQRHRVDGGQAGGEDDYRPLVETEVRLPTTGSPPDLKGLGQLEKLWLKGTNVTNKGVKKLQQELPHCKIDR